MPAIISPVQNLRDVPGPYRTLPPPPSYVFAPHTEQVFL
jgi:hypothetical protein